MQLEGPSYRLLGKPLPALPFKPGDQGNFNVKEGSVSQQLINRMTDAAEHAHEKLVQARKEELSRTDVISALEPVLPEEFGRGECITGGPCEAGWKDVGERQASVVYLSSLVDLSKYKRKVYIDGGANSYDSSIGGWFLRSYPQASLDFQIYAFEVDQRYKKTYVDTGVEFIRYALWTHNTTLHAGPMNSILLVSVCLMGICLACLFACLLCTGHYHLRILDASAMSLAPIFDVLSIDATAPARHAGVERAERPRYHRHANT